MATSTGGDPDMVFTNTCEFPADTATQEPYDPRGDVFFYEVGPEAGTVPATADCVVLWEFEGTGSMTITLFVA